MGFQRKLYTYTPRGFRTVRTGYAYCTYGLRVPAFCVCCTYQRRRATGPEAPSAVRTPYAYQPRACRTYRVPWHHRQLQEELLEDLGQLVSELKDKSMQART